MGAGAHHVQALDVLAAVVRPEPCTLQQDGFHAECRALPGPQAVLEVLRRRNYTGWVSLEAFDFTPGAENLANQSLRHLESVIAQLPS